MLCLQGGEAGGTPPSTESTSTGVTPPATTDPDGTTTTDITPPGTTDPGTTTTTTEPPDSKLYTYAWLQYRCLQPVLIVALSNTWPQ